MTSLLLRQVRRGTGKALPEIYGSTGISAGIGTTPPETTDEQKLGQFALVAKKGSIHLVNSLRSTTESSATAVEPSEFGESSQATAVEPSEFGESPVLEQWRDIQIDTNQLLPHAFKAPPLKSQKPFAGGFRARVRRTTHGILIRIIRKLSHEVEEVADIQMHAFQPSNGTNGRSELDGKEFRGFELDASSLRESPLSRRENGPTTATRDHVALFDNIFDISPYPAWASGPSFPLTTSELDPADLGESEEPISSISSEAGGSRSEREPTLALTMPENNPKCRQVSLPSSIIGVHLSNSQHQPELTFPISSEASSDSQSLRSRCSYQLQSTPGNTPSSAPTSSLDPKSPPSPSFSFVSREPDTLIRQSDRRSAQSNKPEPKPKPWDRRRSPPAPFGAKDATSEGLPDSQVHRNTLGAISSLAVTYQDSGTQNEAENSGAKVLEGRKELGGAHSDTQTATTNLAATYWSQGRIIEAEALEVEALEARMKGFEEAASYHEPWTQRRLAPYSRKTNMTTDEGESSDIASTENPPTSNISRRESQDEVTVNTVPPSYDTNEDRNQGRTEATRRPDLSSADVRAPSAAKIGTDDQVSRLEGQLNTEPDDLVQRAETRSPISPSGVLTGNIVIHRGLNKWIQASAYDYSGHDWALGNDFGTSNIEETQLALSLPDDKIAVDPVSSSIELGSLAGPSQQISPPLHESSQISSLGSLHPSRSIEAVQDTLSQRSDATEVSQEHASDPVSQGYPTVNILGTRPPEGYVFRHRITNSQSTGISPSPTINDISLADLPTQTPISPHHNVAELSVEPDISSLGIDRASQIPLLAGSYTEFERTNDIKTRARRLQASIFRYIKLISIAISTNLVQLAQYFLYRQQIKLRVPAGRVRIKWRCKCGQQLFDDFVEVRPGAAKNLEDHLNRHPQAGTGSPTSSSSGSSSSASRANSSSTRPSAQTSLSSTSFGDIGLSRTSQYSPVIQERGQPAIVPLSGFSEPRWLLTCASGERFDTRLYHVDVNAVLIKSDRDLAVRLRQQYSQLRAPWHQILRLRGLATIQFVQFEVHRSRAVDIRKCPDMPPPSSANYIFAPSDLLPPVGENYLMHLFHHPQDYDDEYITYVRLPKKCGTRLRVLQNRDVEIGWGINLVEGFQAARVWAMAVGVFLTSSLVFGAVWAAKRGFIGGVWGFGLDLHGADINFSCMDRGGSNSTLIKLGRRPRTLPGHTNRTGLDQPLSADPTVENPMDNYQPKSPSHSSAHERITPELLVQDDTSKDLVAAEAVKTTETFVHPQDRTTDEW
ncbi:hypothetical protein GP486_001553 [Trichoglossum hirsutum]|uniref:Uncharacterized protein n=1 Tax=Trichoglossum hirsutum TaxID=265104 RepID=A0A9P8LGH0_9PEZI|nr:hypothetical protein GP486_001553 [Trichoglossum hirsutum]